MFGRTRSLFAAGLSLFVAGCSQPRYLTNPAPVHAHAETACPYRLSASSLCLSWQWTIKPSLKEETVGELIFQTYRFDTAQNEALLADPGTSATLTLWMPSMNHDSSRVSVQRISTGLYRATNVYFNMDRDWELQFDFFNGSQKVDQARVPYFIQGDSN